MTTFFVFLFLLLFVFCLQDKSIIIKEPEEKNPCAMRAALTFVMRRTRKKSRLLVRKPCRF